MNLILLYRGRGGIENNVSTDVESTINRKLDVVNAA